MMTFAKSHEQDIDQIVAVVNDDVITRSELNDSISLLRMQLSQQNISIPAEKVLQKQVLEQLINKRLQLQIAKQAGVNVSDADLDAAISRIAQQNNVSTTMLYERLTQDGMTIAQYRNEMREQMTLQKLQQQEVVSRITITPEEVNTFLRSATWQDNSSKEYRIEDILIPLSDTPSSDEIASARKKAEAVIAKLNQGKNFKEVAQAESAAKQALDGGDLGWRSLAEIPSAFAEQVARMQPKEIAGPIQTPNGFHIIHLAAARQSGKSSAPSRKEVEDLLLQRKFDEAVQNWVSKLRSQAFIVSNSAKANVIA